MPVWQKINLGRCPNPLGKISPNPINQTPQPLNPRGSHSEYVNSLFSQELIQLKQQLEELKSSMYSHDRRDKIQDMIDCVQQILNYENEDNKSNDRISSPNMSSIQRKVLVQKL
ncbi:hypothetical protein [Bacillus cereus]|uniref:hypothetical protein n=1 Tax=Bacillus cereus TaxID=1396 RepID=UPI001642C1D1|nr:hypothetical protein [Bacillus cereus]